MNSVPIMYLFMKINKYHNGKFLMYNCTWRKKNIAPVVFFISLMLKDKKNNELWKSYRALMECHLDAGRKADASSVAGAAATFIKQNVPHLYKQVFGLIVSHFVWNVLLCFNVHLLMIFVAWNLDFYFIWVECIPVLLKSFRYFFVGL